jgi:hypothetical protein
MVSSTSSALFYLLISRDFYDHKRFTQVGQLVGCTNLVLHPLVYTLHSDLPSRHHYSIFMSSLPENHATLDGRFGTDVLRMIFIRRTYFTERPSSCLARFITLCNLKQCSLTHYDLFDAG